MKKRMIALIVSGVLVISIPVALLAFGLVVPAQFDEAYYGELPVLHENLKKQNRRKIVYIGNSSIAFGVRSDLMARELPGYAHVNFGLYGAVGTKAMMELAKPHLKDGDIAVLIPEPYQQTSSLYFSTKETWRALDGDRSLLWEFASDERGALLASFDAYALDKLTFWAKGTKPSAEAPYNKASFIKEDGTNEGYIVAPRDHNVMAGGYDMANLPILSKEVYGEGFLNYLNRYSRELSEKGVRTYFGFAPVNSLATSGDSLEISDSLFDYLSANLDFPLLGHPYRYFMDYRYFYDNNVHMNSAGMTAYTHLLSGDMKLSLQIYQPSFIEVAPPPEIPAEEIEEGDQTDEGKFVYEERDSATGRYCQIVGLTEEGKNASTLILPSTHDDLPVRGFDPDVFAGNQNISRITLPKTIRGIGDYSFNGATRLSELYFQHDSILGLSVGMNFLEGAERCYLYVKKTVSLADCAGGWSRYQSRIRLY